MTEQSPDYLPQDAKPEALRLANVALPRYKIGYRSDEWGMGGSTLTGIPSPDGAWVRFDDVQALQTGYDAARLEIVSLQSKRDKFRHALNEWHDKTEWVQKNATTQELGKHHADVLTDRITALVAMLGQEREVTKALRSYRRAAEEEYARLRSMIDVQRTASNGLLAEAIGNDLRYDSGDWLHSDSVGRIQWLHSMYESSKSEVARLEAQLDAVGAGGVEPLRRAKCLHQIAEPKQKPVAFGSAEEFSSSDDPHCKNGGKACIDCLMRGECLHQTVEPVPEAAQEPMFWVRLTDSGGYEGPLHRSSIEDVHKKSGAWTPLYTEPQPPAVEPVPTHWIESLPAMAREIFCGYPPETQKEVDDVIEWFCSSIYVAMSNVQKAQPPAPIQENEPFPHDEDLLEQLYWDFDHESSKGGQDRLTFKSKLRFYAQHVARQLPAVAQDRFDIDSLVVVPRSLLGSACSAIDKKRDAPATISELRRYTVGDLAIPSQISQKPVVWRYVPSSWKSAVLTDDPEQAKLAAETGVPVTPLYAAPQPPAPVRHPLTNEQITKAFNEAMRQRQKEASNAETNRLFVRAIEAAHGITAPKPLWLPSDDTEGGAV